MRILRRFAAYSPLERRLVVKAWFVVATVRILLWVVPYRRIEAWFMAPPALTVTSVTPAEMALAVTRASTLVPFASCLTQAVAAGFLMRRAGRNAIIHFGVAKGERSLKAHAWLKCDDRILVGGREAAAFVPLTRSSEANSR